MDSLVTDFHLDWHLLVAQTVNFAIVIAVLYWLAFKPLLKVMTERGQKIAEGLANAEKTAAELVKAQSEQAKIIKTARVEAQNILAQAAILAEDERVKAVDKSKQEIEKLITQTKTKLRQEKAELVVEVRAEVCQLVAEACQKVLGQTMSEAADSRLIKTIVEKL